MTNKILPLRKCVACQQMVPKNELFRVVKTIDGISIDLTFKAQGRGAYVCRKRECIELAEKKKSFNRSLKCPVKQEVIDSLYLELENGR